MSRWLSFAHGRISREEFEKELRSYTENENDILPFPNSDFITFKPPYQSEWTSEDKMKDWLDTDEFKKCVNRLHDFDAGQKLSVIPLEMLKEKIREHFVPTPVWTKITNEPETWPPVDIPVLIHFDDKIDVATRDAKIPELTLDCCCFVVRNADAWMPLPQPWKGKMKDWFSSEDYKKWLKSLHGFTWDQKGAERHLRILHDKVREHFVPRDRCVLVASENYDEEANKGYYSAHDVAVLMGLIKE